MTVQSTNNVVGEMPAESFARFAAIITRELGIKMPPNKSQMLHSRLMRRIHALGLDGLEAYQHYLFDSPDGASERVHFLDAVTTNKTDFFREPQHFHHLLGPGLRSLSSDRVFSASEPFQLWCAGCSTGEEPYTLTMLLSEHAEAERRCRREFRFRLLATDISTRALSHARTGIYHESRIGPIPLPLRQKYLLRHRQASNPQVRFAAAVREKISFHSLNFMSEDYRVRNFFDVIFFRNVLIYFDRNTQERVLQRVLGCARPGALLFVGHSESLSGLQIPVRQIGPAIFEKSC